MEFGVMQMPLDCPTSFSNSSPILLQATQTTHWFIKLYFAQSLVVYLGLADICSPFPWGKNSQISNPWLIKGLSPG